MNSNNRAVIGLGHAMGSGPRCSAAWIACGLTVGLAANLWGQGAGLSATTGSLDRTIEGAGSTISFSGQVAPLLNKHCGDCHVRSSKGDFSMASFGRLAAASGVIAPGNPSGSKLITMIESGKMPPKGEVPPAELATLKTWVQSGAAFDGTDRNASLASMGGSASAAAKPAAPGRGNGRRQGSGGYDEEEMYDEEGMDPYEDMDTYEEEMYGEDMYSGDYDPSGSGRRRGVQSDAELTYIESFKAALSDAGWSSILAPAPPELALATGPVLKRDAEQAFAAGDYPLALELFFGYLAAEYPDSLVDLQTVKFSQLLHRPVWNVRLGVSMSVRGTTSSGDRSPIRESANGRRVAEAGPAAARGRGRFQPTADYGMDEQNDYEAEMESYAGDMGMDDLDYDDMDMDDYENESGYDPRGRRGSRSQAAAAPKRTMLSASAKETMDKTLGLVAEYVGDEFTKRFRQGDFGPILIAVEPPPEEDARPNQNVRAQQTPDPAVATVLPGAGPMSTALSEMLAEAPQPMPMWIPAVSYLGEGVSSDELLKVAKSAGLDLLIHFDVVLKEGRAVQGRNADVQNISRCRLMHVDTGKSIVTSKAMDNREAAQLAAAGRSGEKGYVEDQLANFFSVVDQKIKPMEMPQLTPEVVRKRVASLMPGSATPSLRTLAEIQLYHAQGLINDSEIEIAFEIVGGPEAMVILYGPPKEKLAMVRKWALRSLNARPAN